MVQKVVIKTGDITTLYFGVLGDIGVVHLGGATVELVMINSKTDDLYVLPATITNAVRGEVSVSFDGTLEAGIYHAELHINKNDELFTAPSTGSIHFLVEKTLDLVELE